MLWFLRRSRSYYFFISLYLVMCYHTSKYYFSVFPACSSWKSTAIPHINESHIQAEKMEKAMEYNNLKLQKYIFCHWHSYVKSKKEQLKGKLVPSSNYFL